MIREKDLAARPPQEEPLQHQVDEGFSRWTHDLSRVSHHILTISAATLFILPLLWMIGASLRQPGLPPPNSLEWVPNPVVLDNYPRLFGMAGLPLGVYLANSLKVVAAAVPLTILTASWAGFAMAQLAPRPRNLLILISLATLMVPVTALWITRFIIYKNIGVLDTLWAVILPSFMGTSPFYVLLFYWAFTRIPSELYEAARLEGAGAFRVWASIGIPLVKPAITAVAVLCFVFYWSNFMDPLLYLNNQQNYTLPIGLQQLQQMARTDFPLLMAGSVVITVPVIAMFMLAQRYFLHDTRGQGWLGR